GPGPARRFANWLGFGNPSGTDDEPGFYAGRPDDEDNLYNTPAAVPPPPEEPPPLPRQTDRDAEPPGLPDAPNTDDASEATDRPRRTRNSSPWEDIMLGSGPPPGTSMSDALPAGTLPPIAAAPRDREIRGGAVSDWLDPMDPVDPLDPRDPDPPSAPDPIAGTPAPKLTKQLPDDHGEDEQPAPPPAEQADQAAHSTPDGPEPRRMLRLLPTPVLADGGGMVVDGGRVGRLTVRAAAVRGGLHSEQGTPRQNSFAVGPDPSGAWTITIVCDGVDGVYAAELAAQVAIRSTYRAVARMVVSGPHEEWDWTKTLDTVRTELHTRLTEIGSRARALGRPAPATRLAVLVTSAEPLHDDRVDMAVLGDSTVLRLSEGGWRAPLGVRETPADAPSPALPEHGTEHARVCRTTWRPSDALVVMTGGYAEALGAGSGGLAARLADDWRRPPELLRFLGDVAEGSHTDDGAVVALWPEP
ncbi:protein phosphatase 2C domain-containing protein, partial [Yinghuangia sp. YIM S10712]|uniref:protein phosphatase 2C domain-containing protein n=1 Tax=Yinghuangia sp. YIM S10712 TaxID=3436930 RepID=UPI003F52F656